MTVRSAEEEPRGISDGNRVEMGGAVTNHLCVGLPETVF